MKKLLAWLADGIDMQEWLAISYFVPWFLIGGLFAWKGYTVGLTETDVDYFHILSWPTLISASFYYGVKLTMNLVMRNRNGNYSNNSPYSNYQQTYAPSIAQPPDIPPGNLKGDL